MGLSDGVGVREARKVEGVCGLSEVEYVHRKRSLSYTIHHTIVRGGRWSCEVYIYGLVSGLLSNFHCFLDIHKMAFTTP